MTASTGFRLSPQQAALAARTVAQRTHGFASLLQVALPRPLTPEAVAARLATGIADAEILRTRIEPVPGLAQAVQVIDAEAVLPFTVEDLRGTGEAEQQARLKSFRALPRHWKRPLSVCLLWLSDEEQVLELAAEATHADLASLQHLAKALIDPAASANGVQYADYAEWKWSVAEDDAGGARFWRDVAQRATPVRLGLEAPSEGDWTPLVHAVALPDHCRTLAPSGLLTAWCALLSRLSAQSQVSITVIDEGRAEGLQDALGLFEQALPLHVELDLDRPLLAQVSTVDRALDAARAWRDHCTLDVPAGYAFAWRRSQGERFALGISHPAKACLEVTERPDGLQCRFVANARVLSAPALACLAEQWVALLSSPQTPVGAVPLLGEIQRARIAPTIPTPVIEPVGIVELIARQIQSHPDAPAVADARETLSYRELDRRARHLAHRLVAAGVAAGTPVGMLLPRGTDAIVAILGVLNAGGAYVPLDPAYPLQRREHMIADSGMRHVVVDTTLAPEVAAVPHRFVIDEPHDAPPIDLPSATDLDAPAYLIYTSGSTGQPKAVEISHRALSHSTQLRFAVYREPVRAYLLLSSFAFDSSVAGIFWTLAQGGCLVLPAPGEELAMDRLSAAVERHRVSHGLSLPSLYEALLEQAPPAALRSLSAWIVAGESCPPSLPVRHTQVLPHAQLVNEYGPTEATVWATVDFLTPGQEVTIGRPIPTMGLQLFAEQGQPCGVGEPGEIVLSGPTLAQGYRDRPAETARTFVTLADGTRAYRTGDLAQWRVDGRLTFMGRQDHQVKLRGFRIELGEIERRLREHADVREAAAVVRELGAGKQLVAYIVARHGNAPEPETMKRFLAERLPAHMVPAHVVALDAFARTPNGKLDLNAMPGPDSLRRHERIAPRNPTEATLAAIVAEVLRVPGLGVLDNFFEVGGDSILSLQVVARARERGIALSAKQVFEAQTVAAMALVATPISAPGEAVEPAGRFAASGLSEDELRSLMSEMASDAEQ
jgi:amino acid adenylation domain-containing protein